jgi:triacylglycerol lipase
MICKQMFRVSSWLVALGGCLNLKVWSSLIGVVASGRSTLKWLGICSLALQPFAQTAANHDYTKTSYPIVLVHGLFGFDDILGVKYWHNIPETLEEGGAQVFVAQVAGAQSSEIRGEQLLFQIEEILALTGASKVNLIGHSHGGLSSRYVAAVRPDLVASVTTVGAPNQGSKVADFVRRVPEDSIAEAAINAVTTAFANLLDFLSGGGYVQDPLAALGSLTTKGTQAFNKKYPAALPKEPCGEGPIKVEGIYYFSWGGTRVMTNAFDLSDPALKAASWAFNGEPNDGLVSSCSSHLGRVIRDDFPMNHLDQVNLIAGLSFAFGSDPISLYRAHLNRLKILGL